MHRPDQETDATPRKASRRPLLVVAAPPRSKFTPVRPAPATIPLFPEDAVDGSPTNF